VVIKNGDTFEIVQENAAEMGQLFMERVECGVVFGNMPKQNLFEVSN
jgi:hypothetical protein